MGCGVCGEEEKLIRGVEGKVWREYMGRMGEGE